MTDVADGYDIDIRDFTAQYNHLLASDANREVDSGFEIQLSTIDVQVKLTPPGRDRSGRSFEVVFSVDHEAHAVEFSSVGDAFGNETSFDPREVMLATEVAGKAVAAWLDDVDVPYEAPEHAITVPQADSDPVVHSNLTVMPDE